MAFALVQKEFKQIDILAVAATYEDLYGLNRLDAIEAAKRCRAGLVGKDMSEQDAERLTEVLSGMEIETVKVPMEQIEALPRMVQVRRVEPRKDGLAWYDVFDRERFVSWSDVVWLGAGRYTEIVEPPKRPTRESKLKQAFTGATRHGASDMIGAALACKDIMQVGKPLRQEDGDEHIREHITLELIVPDAGFRYRVDAKDCNYAILGDGMAGNPITDFVTLCRWFDFIMPEGLKMDNGLKATLAEDWEDVPLFSSEEAWDSFCLWSMHRWGSLREHWG